EVRRRASQAAEDHACRASGTSVSHGPELEQTRSVRAFSAPPLPAPAPPSARSPITHGRHAEPLGAGPTTPGRIHRNPIRATLPGRKIVAPQREIVRGPREAAYAVVP